MIIMKLQCKWRALSIEFSLCNSLQGEFMNPLREMPMSVNVTGAKSAQKTFAVRESRGTVTACTHLVVASYPETLAWWDGLILQSVRSSTK